MKQALEMSCVPACQPASRSWLGRLLAAFSTRPQQAPLVRPELLSRQMLRDIGLGEEVRGNPLLRDGWLRR